MQEFNIISEKWDAIRKEESLIFKAFTPFFTKAKTVLDAGCGNGRNIKSLTNYFQQVYGIDSSRELLKLALKNNEKLVEQGKLILSLQDFNNTFFEDNFFDCIVGVASFHHSKNLEETLLEAKRILRPKGQLFFSLWNYYQPKFFDKGKEQLIKFGNVKRYYHFYEEEELINLVQRHFKLSNYFYEFKGKKIIDKFKAENLLVCAIKN
ncbi:Ubiquinone biosynthesis O-methyltransferase [uncultured archaeon]|nr:Ubiquinone biosynthesis O-methyltransferase [uncultured archaeon]